MEGGLDVGDPEDPEGMDGAGIGIPVLGCGIWQAASSPARTIAKGNLLLITFILVFVAVGSAR